MKFWLLFLILPFCAFTQNFSTSETKVILDHIFRVYNNNRLKTDHFTFDSYEKTILTANPDLISDQIDTIYQNKKKSKFVIDSSAYKFKKIVEKQHLYAIEKFSKIEMKNKKTFESIQQLKMAGLKKPIYELIGIELVPLKYTTEFLKIFGFSFNNPLLKEHENLYEYELTRVNKEVLQLTFKLKKTRSNKNISGIYYINSRNFSVFQSEIYLNGIIKLKVKTSFVFHTDFKNYLPVSQEIVVEKGKGKYNINVLGETIYFENTTGITSQKFDYSKYTYLQIERRFENYSNKASGKKYKANIEIEPMYNSGIDNFFHDDKICTTYESIDSLVSVDNYENKLYFGKKLINGKIPFKKVDVIARELFKYNHFEGIRLGLGLQTNDRFSKIHQLFGYGAYGFKDKKWKGQLGYGLLIDKNSATKISLAYSEDLKEFGDITFSVDKKRYRLIDPRLFNLVTFYNAKLYQFSIDSHIFNNNFLSLSFSKNTISPLVNYSYKKEAFFISNFTMPLVNINWVWSPFSKFLAVDSDRIEVEKKYPIVHAQLEKTIPNWWGNPYNFTKIDLRFNYIKKLINGHKIYTLWQSGMAIGKTPLTHLYSTVPNLVNKENFIQRITFASPFSFETMLYNEFFSDRYTFIIVKYAFRKLELSKHFNPTFMLGNKFAVGYLSNKKNHVGIEFNTLEKGYIETGFELQNIYKGIGLSSYYRVGPYQLPRWEDNLAIKISFNLNLGI